MTERLVEPGGVDDHVDEVADSDVAVGRAPSPAKVPSRGRHARSSVGQETDPGDESVVVETLKRPAEQPGLSDEERDLFRSLEASSDSSLGGLGDRLSNPTSRIGIIVGLIVAVSVGGLALMALLGSFLD